MPIISVGRYTHTRDMCSAQLLLLPALVLPPHATLRYGASTKAAVMRIGLLEMWSFIRMYFDGKDMSTLLESCGVADLIATCSGGRNRRVSEAFVKTGKVSIQCVLGLIVEFE